MTRTQLMIIASLPLLAGACSGNSSKGSSGTTTGGTGIVQTSTTGTSTGTGGAGTGVGPGTTSGGAAATTTGGTANGSASSGTTTGGPAAPDFALIPVPSSLTLPAGGEQTIRIDIQRDAGGTLDTDVLVFGLVSDGGVMGVFDPLETDGGATALTISTEASVSAGSYVLTIVASSATNVQSYHEADVNLTVSSEVVTTLLVDNDNSQNNADGGGIPSTSDTLFEQLLAFAGIPFNTYVIPSTSLDTFDSAVLANYSTVIWYTGANNITVGNGCLSSAQEQFLEAWLDQGNKTLLMFAPYLVQDLEPFYFWNDTPDNQFLSLYLGAQGCDQNPQQLFEGKSFVATGVAGTNFESADEDGGQVFQVAPSPIQDTASVINPGDGGTQPLVTVAADEAHVGAPQAVPCTLVNYNTGQAGTSTVVFVGIPVEDIQGSSLDAGSAYSFFSAAILESQH